MIGVKRQESVKALSEALRKELALVVLETSDGEKIRATTSIGVSSMRAGETVSKGLSRADKALYEAKNNGRNQVVIA